MWVEMVLNPLMVSTGSYFISCFHPHGMPAVSSGGYQLRMLPHGFLSLLLLK